MKEQDTDAAPQAASSLSRRNFLKKSSLAAFLGASGVELARAGQEAPTVITRRQEKVLTCGVIGFGPWGREIAAALSRFTEAKVAAVCDSYDVMLKRAERSVPEATTHADYREVLDNPEIQAVFVATPTHLHREIVVAALEAGKHVYCEAPMAASIEDARAIALAAKAHPKQIFQVGLLFRSDPQHRSVFQFIRSGALGKPVMARSQWHAKESWRRASPSPERAREQNWRLDPDVSVGLVGEVGLQQLDKVIWIYQTLPTAVTGFGQIRLWDDGRTIPDTIQAIFEFDNGTNAMFDATLASSFDASYDMFYGSDSTIMLRDQKAWMFKEVDAPMLGWEVYARKDTFYREKGIALVANATKLDAQAVDPAADDPNTQSPLYYAMKEFIDNFFFGPYPPAVGYQTGFESAVIGVKAHEAIMKKQRVTIDPALMNLG